jgi:hypothetical protein
MGKPARMAECRIEGYIIAQRFVSTPRSRTRSFGHCLSVSLLSRRQGLLMFSRFLAIISITLCSVPSAVLAAPREKETVVRPAAGPGPLDNPLKGWCPYTDAGMIHLPYSMVFFPVSWQELEPRPGQYDFEGWEKRAWDVDAARGKHVMIRIYLDMPARPIGVPQWLRDQGLKMTPYTDYGGGQSPDYDDDRLVKGLESLIAALGRRYDEQPRVAFVQLGLLGFWGEWHTYPRNELFAGPKTQKRVVDAYHKAFPHKRLMARKPADYVGQQTWIGFHDDMFPEDTDGSEGWKFLPLLRASKRTNNWKRSVVGGEMVFNGNQPWLGEGIETTRKRLADAHFTWIGPYCPALEAPPNEQFTQRANDLVRRMGYEFKLNEVRHAAEVNQGNKLAFSLEGENQGVAPFYYRWEVELALMDDKSNVVEKLPLDWDIRKWSPGKFSEKGSIRIEAKPGKYQLGFGIRDPWTDRPTVALANQLPLHDGWTILSKIKILASK